MIKIILISLFAIVLVIAIMDVSYDKGVMCKKILNRVKSIFMVSPENRKAFIYAVAIIISSAIISFAYLYSNRYSHVKGFLYYDKWKKEIINVTK